MFSLTSYYAGFQRTSIPIASRSSRQRHFGNGLRSSEPRDAYIEPGSPWKNVYCKSFNETPRDELLNGDIFYTLNEPKIAMEAWRRHYNAVRPHSSLDTNRRRLRL